jgi:hypothetical protein
MRWIMISYVLLFSACSIQQAWGQITVPCADDKEQEHIRAIILEGIDLGLKNHTARQFDLWMKDQSEQPGRALTGMDTAVKAYMRSRENAQHWNPPPCPAVPPPPK